MATPFNWVAGLTFSEKSGLFVVGKRARRMLSTDLKRGKKEGHDNATVLYTTGRSTYNVACDLKNQRSIFKIEKTYDRLYQHRSWTDWKQLPRSTEYDIFSRSHFPIRTLEALNLLSICLKIHSCQTNMFMKKTAWLD